LIPKSDLYRNLLPLLNSRRVQLLDDRRLISQLHGLERRTARGGRDSIDHAPGQHDDVANSVAGACGLIAAFVQKGPVAATGTFRTYVYDAGDVTAERRYKTGKYGQRVEIVPDWVERGERFPPGNPRLLLDTNEIAH
jgi:hypothetical protein